MKYIIPIITFLILLLGCNSKEREAGLLKELAERTFTTKAFNYTKYDLYNILYKDAAIPFKVESAVNGGSVFFRDSGRHELGAGQEVAIGSNHCCLIWSESTEKPLEVRIKWGVVFDLDALDGKLKDRRDERTFKRRGRGSAWCEAIVTIAPASADIRPDRIIFHFLPDGTVMAQHGTIETSEPLSSEIIKMHSLPLPDGQFCKKETDNPFYGVPRTDHRE